MIGAQFTRVDAVEVTERGLRRHAARRAAADRAGARRRRADQAQPRRRVRRRAHARGDRGWHRRRSPSRATRCAPTALTVTLHARPVRDRRPPRGRHARARVHAARTRRSTTRSSCAARAPGRRDLRPGGEGRARATGAGAVHALEHRHPQPDGRGRVRRQRRRHRVRPVLRLDPVLLPPHEGRAR